MSHSEMEIAGDLPKIIGNEENLYEGNLIYYFQVLFFRANNLYNPTTIFGTCRMCCGSVTRLASITHTSCRRVKCARCWLLHYSTTLIILGARIGAMRIRTASTLRSPFPGFVDFSHLTTRRSCPRSKR